MGTPSEIEVCRADRFTKESDMRQRYPQQIVDNVQRVREMYNWSIANPDGNDREFDSLFSANADRQADNHDSKQDETEKGE